jgi:hypothetical protein
MKLPLISRPGGLDVREGREATSVGQLPPLRVDGHDSDLQLTRASLAAQELIIQLTREEANVPGQNQRNTPVLHPIEMVAKGGQVIVNLQLNNGGCSCAHR